LLGKILTRPDVIKGGFTAQFLKELAAIYVENRDNEWGGDVNFMTGIMSTLVEIFKIGHREDFLPLIEILFEPIIEAPITNKI